MNNQGHSCSLTSQAHIQQLASGEDDTSTVRDDMSDSSSISSIPDENNLGWRNFRVPSSETTTVFEAWEILYVRPSNELRSTTKVLGVDVKATYVVARDGYTGVRAVPYYTQEELAHMVKTAHEAYNPSGPKHWYSRIKNRRSYAQDLAARLFALPGSLVNRLGALLDTRHSATNKSQYARREWKVVFMKLIENPIAGEDGQGHLKRRQQLRKNDPMQKWLLIVRGQVTKTSEDGFVAFDTSSNPWLKTDECVHREKADLRMKYANH